MKERLLEFCRRKGLSMLAFERAAGWSPSTIYNMNKGIRSDKLASAAVAFPDLDLRWLLTGESSERIVNVNIMNVDELAGLIGSSVGKR